MVSINLKGGGAAMRRSRLAAGFMTLEQVTRRSFELWGERHKVTGAEISRLENGRKDRPPLEMFGKLSLLYRVSLTQIAEWYGYPYYGGVVPSEDKRITFARSVADSLPPAERERLYDAILLSAQMADFQFSAQHKAVKA